jgi:hypothetical protein
MDDIDARLRATPFSPLRIVTASGETFEIAEPNTVILAGQHLIIGVAMPERSRVAGRVVYVAVGHITSMDHLSPSTTATASRRKRAAG